MTDIVPRSATRLCSIGFRLSLEKLPGDRVQTGLIDVAGVEFKAWSRTDRIDDAIESLARELARHLKITRDDVAINEDAGNGIHGKRRFRLIAWYRGKPKECTDAGAAFMQWKNSGSAQQPQLPEYIDI